MGGISWMRRLPLATVLAVVLTLVAGACSSSSDDGSREGGGTSSEPLAESVALDTWQDAATEVCDEHVPLLEDVDEEHGQVPDVEALAAYLEDLVPVADDYVDAMVALPNPDDRSEEVEDLNNDLTATRQVLHDFLRAADDGDQQAIDDESMRLIVLMNATNRRAALLGVSACDRRTGADNPAIAGCETEDFGALAGEADADPEAVADSVVAADEELSSVVALGEHEARGKPAFLFKALDAEGTQVGVIQVALAPIGEYTGFLFPCKEDGGSDPASAMEPRPVDPRRGIPDVAPTELPLEFGGTSGDSFGMPGTTAGALVTNPRDDEAAYFVEVRFDLVGSDGDVLDRTVVVIDYIAPGATAPAATTSFGTRVRDEAPDHIEVFARGQLLLDEGPVTNDGAPIPVTLEVLEARVDTDRFGAKLFAEVANESDVDVRGFTWTCVFLRDGEIVGGHAQVGPAIRHGATATFDWTIPASITSDESVCSVEGLPEEG